jgi:hypothetical protein
MMSQFAWAAISIGSELLYSIVILFVSMTMQFHIDDVVKIVERYVSSPNITMAPNTAAQDGLVR